MALTPAERQRAYRQRKAAIQPAHQEEDSAPTALYRHFSPDGRLLYVGISINALSRLTAHLSGSAWAEQIARVEIERFPSRRAALDAERKAIRAECPKFNIVHALPRPPVDLVEFAALVEELYDTHQLSAEARDELFAALRGED